MNSGINWLRATVTCLELSVHCGGTVSGGSPVVVAPALRRSPIMLAALEVILLVSCVTYSGASWRHAAARRSRDSDFGGVTAFAWYRSIHMCL
jgi:hypothetical protein